eukprot:SAG31_NODE_21173_length_556_cov_0.789934_2_plen_142_part_01
MQVWFPALLHLDLWLIMLCTQCSCAWLLLRLLSAARGSRRSVRGVVRSPGGLNWRQPAGPGASTHQQGLQGATRERHTVQLHATATRPRASVSEPRARRARRARSARASSWIRVYQCVQRGARAIGHQLAQIAMPLNRGQW